MADHTQRQLLAMRPAMLTALAATPTVTKVWPSATNFIMLDSTDPAAIMVKAREVRLLLRDFSNGTRTPGAVRISLGTPEQNMRLLRALGAPLPEGFV